MNVTFTHLMSAIGGLAALVTLLVGLVGLFVRMDNNRVVDALKGHLMEHVKSSIAAHHEACMLRRRRR
jgi:hypothetical protein